MPLLVFLLALAVFAQGTSEFMLAGLLPEIAGDLDISLATAGLLTSTFAVGMVIGAPVMAACGRRWPPRTSLVAFLATFVAMHVVGALTHSIVLLLVTRVVAAVANAGFLALTLALVVRVVPEGKRAKALSVVLAGTTIALVAGAPLGAFVGSVWSWRTAMWAIVRSSSSACPLSSCWCAPRHAMPRSRRGHPSPLSSRCCARGGWR